MARVLNKHRDYIPLDAIYIGRGSKFGNPFRIGVDGTRAEVIEKYKHYLLERTDLLRDLDELHGKDLWCFCKPEVCHGDVLLWLANL